MGAGPFCGGINGDEQGMGKSLTTLIACETDNLNVKGCFNLILTTKTCSYQWYEEVVQHFRGVSNFHNDHEVLKTDQSFF